MAWMFDGDRPIYLQIVERIERDILSGKLKKGDKLPSVRELAVTASVNPNTVQRAMQELETREIVISQRTTGRQVTDDDEKIEKMRTQLAKSRAAEFISEMRQLGFSAEQINELIKGE